MLNNDELKKKAEALVVSGQLQSALHTYEEILKLDNRDASAWLSLGLVFRQMSKTKEAQSCFTRAIQADPGLAKAHFYLGDIFREQGLFDAAEQSFQNAVRYDSASSMAYYQLGNMQQLQGRVEDAIDSYCKALAITSPYPEAYWSKFRTLPVIYDNNKQIDLYRKMYADGLRKLNNEMSLDTFQKKSNALKGLAAGTNFYLQYQGRDDLELQKQYGDILHRVMGAVYPQWSVPVKMPPLAKDEKIRVGYASTFLRDHNGAVWLLGWLSHRDRENFEIYCYHTGIKVDEKTREFKNNCDYFYHIPGNLEKACEQISSDKLHILVYPELGMDALSMVMAGLRLAPIQCVGWGHPVTSGLPTMDYWLSSDLMEPENGQEHYSEELIRLPNMANCHSIAQHDQLQSVPPIKNRSDFNLREDAVIYLCSQSLFKYLPEYDYILPEIAKEVPNVQFVFLAISSVHVVKRFIQRVDKSFSAVGLNAQDYCTILNRLSPKDYLAINQVADIFLDNPPWSGNNTTLVAIDCHLPIVTYPTEYMRGRHTYAILKMLGLTETIADNEQEYIDIAVRLGIDEQWRKEIVRKIANQYSRIYEDTSCVLALEEFYKKAIESRS